MGEQCWGKLTGNYIIEGVSYTCYTPPDVTMGTGWIYLSHINDGKNRYLIQKRMFPKLPSWYMQEDLGGCD